MKFNELETPKHLLDFFEKNLKYGFVSDGKLCSFEEMNKLYKLCINKELIDAGYGVCWDFVELQRAFFEEKGIKHKSFWIDSLAQGGNTHTFSLFNEDGKCKWFEYAWGDKKGIHEYPTIQEALDDIRKKYKEDAQERFNIQIDNAELFQYQKPTRNYTAQEFIGHCRNTTMAKDSVQEQPSQLKNL